MIFFGGVAVGILVASTVMIIITGLTSKYDGNLIIIPDEEDGDYMFVETDVPPSDWKKLPYVTLEVKVKEAKTPE